MYAFEPFSKLYNLRLLWELYNLYAIYIYIHLYVIYIYNYMYVYTLTATSRGIEGTKIETWLESSTYV